MAEKRKKSSAAGWLAVAFGAGLVGYAVASLSGRVRNARALRRKLPRRTGEPRGHLRQSILGANKYMVQAVFGPPRSAGGLTAVPGAQSTSPYWQADVWYYALDPRRKVAMAIRFANGMASEVEFIPAV